MALRVLHQRRQRPAHDLRIALGARQVGRRDHRDVGEAPGQRAEIDAPVVARGAAPGDVHEYLHGPVELLGLGDHRAERRGAPHVGVGAGRTKRQFGLPPEPRDRGAQLVRGVLSEPLLVAARGGDPLEQVVERRGEPGELVARGPEIESSVEVVGAPLLRRGGHLRHRAQRAVDGRADGEPAGEQRERREHERAEQHLLLEALERRGRGRDHDRADGRAAGPARQRSDEEPPVVRALSFDRPTRAPERHGALVQPGRD